MSESRDEIIKLGRFNLGLFIATIFVSALRDLSCAKARQKGRHWLERKEGCREPLIKHDCYGNQISSGFLSCLPVPNVCLVSK